jgi:ADP-ribose pyrophosphatase YjhB (NUDIX family)
MGFEPQKFFIGLVDCFSIFLPGALLAYLRKNWAAAKFLGADDYSLDTVEHLVVFLFASYLLGHLIFLIGSFLDDWVYDPFRKATSWGQVGRLSDGKTLYPYYPYWLRRMAESTFFFGNNPDAAVMKVQRLKARSLAPFSTAGAINSYQWCRALLSKQHPEGFVAVQRFEADSKFFRSFVVVLAILAPIYAFKTYPNRMAAVFCLVLVIPALMRYCDQRFKGTQYAYWSILTLDALNEQPAPSTCRDDALSHASGVVYKKGKSVEYLLVESASKLKWVLPKGRIEPGEGMRETAVRNVLEETGCWARVVSWIGDEDLVIDGDRMTTRIFLMEFLEQSRKKSRNEDRQISWNELEQAQRWTTGLTPGFLAEADRLVRNSRQGSTDAPESSA